MTSIAAISIVNKMKVPYYLCLSIFSLDISPGPFSWLESNSGDMIDYQRETVSNEKTRPDLNSMDEKEKARERENERGGGRGIGDEK